MDDRKTDVRLTAIDVILDAYLDAGRDVPLEIVDKLRQMAQDDPCEEVCRLLEQCLDEPWARKEESDLPV